jgi:hypothetical protein
MVERRCHKNLVDSATTAWSLTVSTIYPRVKVPDETTKPQVSEGCAVNRPVHNMSRTERMLFPPPRCSKIHAPIRTRAPPKSAIMVPGRTAIIEQVDELAAGAAGSLWPVHHRVHRSITFLRLFMTRVAASPTLCPQNRHFTLSRLGPRPLHAENEVCFLNRTWEVVRWPTKTAIYAIVRVASSHLEQMVYRSL